MKKNLLEKNKTSTNTSEQNCINNSFQLYNLIIILFFFFNHSFKVSLVN